MIYFHNGDSPFNSKTASGFLVLSVKKSNRTTRGTNSFYKFLGLLQINDTPIYYFK